MAVGRKFMIGHIKYTLAATIPQREDMSAAAAAAGIGWGEMVVLAEKVALDASRKATDAAVEEMAGWTAEQWAQAKRRFA